MHPPDIFATLIVSRRRLQELTKENPSLPKPAAELATGRVWETADIEKWAKVAGREIGKGA